MQTVGPILRAEREKRGMSVKDVEAGTSIRALYISAIESDDYGKLPGEVYLKGFIKNYAAFLGLSAEELLEVYRQSQNPSETKSEQPRVVDEKKPERYMAANQGDKGDDKKTFARIVAAFIILGLAAGGWWFVSQGSVKPPAPNVQPSPSGSVQPPAPAGVPSPTANIKPTGKPVVLSAKFIDWCWTYVKIDGRDAFEGTPKAGESFTWEADKMIEVTFGNAAAVELTYNGGQVGKIGGNGEVITKKFSVNAAKP